MARLISAHGQTNFGPWPDFVKLLKDENVNNVNMNSVNENGLVITDLIWNSSNFVLDLKENKDLIILSAKNEFSDKTPRPSKALVDIKQYKQLLEIKEKIQNCLHWDKWSKLVNPYDKVQYL